jgi:hypothetical protein
MSRGHRQPGDISPCCCHNTHAHSAQAVAAEVSSENAASSKALRPSRIIACLTRQSFALR